MNCNSVPMLIPTTASATANKLLMLSPKPKPKPTNSRANDLINVPRRKKQSNQKTEGKCKISTAHGLRDRRVRLSIDIARQFFDLQDSLGFDTASKTLDWLLTKSTTAIKDLQTSSECKAAAGVTFSGAINVDSNNNVVYNKKNSKFCTKKGVPVDRENKEERFAQKFDNSDSAKEQRVKARARARKRTAVKNCIRKLSQQQMVLKPADSELLQPIQFCKTYESKLFCFSHKLNGIAQSEETFGNNLGTVITNKLKPSTLTAADNLQEMNSCTTLNFSGDLHGVLEEYINICSRSITTTLK